MVKPGQVLMVAMVAISAIAQNAQPDPSSNPLSLYFGRWTSSAQMYDTAMSRVQTINAKLDCSWTQDAKFLVCDQTINSSVRGESNQLTVYSYNAEKKSYVYSTFQGPGTEPRGGVLEVGDHKFVYAGSYENGGKRTLFRTTNTFNAAGDEYSFLGEYSTDDGQTWTKMLQGTAKRLAAK